MSNRGLHSAVIIACVTVWTGEAVAQKVRRVGIVTTVSVNATVDETNELARTLGKIVREKLSVDVIAGAEAQRRLPPDGLPAECVAEAQCRSEVGERLDADELLLLAVVRLGGRIQIDPTWANTGTGEVHSRDAIVIEPGQDPEAVFADAAQNLLPHIEKLPERQREIIVVGGGADDGRRFTRGTWIAMGVAGAALVGGAVFTFTSRQKFDDLDQKGCRGEALCTQSEIDSLRRHTLAADLLLATSLAAGVTAVVLYARSGGETPERAKTAVTVGAGSDSIGVSVGGSF